MATLSALKRLGQLGWWLGLSTGAMLVAAFGTMFASACGSSSPSSTDAGPSSSTNARSDATTKIKVDSPGLILPSLDANVQEAGAPTDASESDLWNTICE